MTDEPRVGVYICHCGLNIAGAVNVSEVAEYAKTLPGVAASRDYVFMCSSPGQDIIKEDVREGRVNRVVVAACSPAMHEATFRGVVKDGGLNPYLLEIANIRENCSWVHPGDKSGATRKAKDQVRMAVAKARLLEPLDELTVKVNPRVMVVGGGVAGMEAALDLAERGLPVDLVEKAPTLGGRAARTGWLAHSNDRGIDMVRHMMSSIESDSLITVMPDSELRSLDGSVGNFRAQVRTGPRLVDDRCILCAECVAVCPVEVPNEFEYGLNRRKAIYFPFKEAMPQTYSIDLESCTLCGKCTEACRYGAIDFSRQPSTKEISFGAVILATGYDPYVPPTGEYGYGLSPNILTLFSLERMLDSSGPTKGELLVGGKVPKSVAFIMCVGSLGTTANAKNYCSRMCCATTLRNVLRIKERHPDVDVYVLYKNITTYGRGDEKLYEDAGKKLVKFARFDKAPEVVVGKEGLAIRVFETVIQDEILIPVDSIILSVGMVPRFDLAELRSVVKVGCGPDDFLREAHLKLRPVEAPTDGIYLAGTVTGPRSIIESVMSGSAAAAKAASLLVKGYVDIEPIIASVDEEACSGCAICLAMCPFGAISLKKKGDNERVAEVDGALCKGCGVCVAACPSGALKEPSYTDLQLKAQVVACLADGGVA
jgi:heterodisulfide reductase subunit A